jgi:hypothetical protein
MLHHRAWPIRAPPWPASETASKVAVSLSAILLFASIPRTGFILFPPNDVSDVTSEARVRQAAQYFRGGPRTQMMLSISGAPRSENIPSTAAGLRSRLGWSCLSCRLPPISRRVQQALSSSGAYKVRRERSKGSRRSKIIIIWRFVQEQLGPLQRELLETGSESESAHANESAAGRECRAGYPSSRDQNLARCAQRSR